MSKQNETSLFSLNDYRPYLQAWGRAKGRGEFRRISRSLKMHTTLVSQVLSGKKSLTEEQASRLCSYMQLNTLETDYFLKLVLLDRTGTPDLRATYSRHLDALRSQAKEARSRVPEPRPLSEADRGIFYSSWQYGVVRLLTSTKDFQTVEAIAFRLGLSISRVREILEFLTSRGLCREEPAGRFTRTPENTHIEATSSLSARHHQNWRAKSIELVERMGSEDLAFTSPVSIGTKDIPKVRAILLETVAAVSKVITTSPPEQVAYLAIDWIRM